MALQDTLTLNSAWLRNRVAELRLKQWWLAEQIGVDKKTVVRWLHGHVRSIRVDNARALADILGCRIDDLTLADERTELATEADQTQAATLLASGVLLDQLGPVGEWNVIEKLIKAIAVPQLPTHVLATLYNQLCVTCWRQSKLDEARNYNEAALALAQRCDDKVQIASALHSRANLQHWRGECRAAHETYRACLAMAPFLNESTIANTHSNFGASLYETGELDAGRAELVLALSLLRLHGTPMQLGIARTHLAILALRGDDVPEAREHTEWSRRHAEQANHKRGLAMAALLQADVDARSGDVASALEQLADGLGRFAELKIEEGLNEEFAARVWRLTGRVDLARAAIDRGLAWAEPFPLEKAQLLIERGLIDRERLDLTSARQSFEAAAALFEACGAERMAQACHRMSLDAGAARP